MGQRVHIFIAEPSHIIRSGIISVLRDIPNIDIAEIRDMSTLLAKIQRYTPDILIVNPSYIGFLPLNQIKSKIAGIKIVALYHMLLDGIILNQYDGSISIYNSVEVIKEKITGLFPNNSSNDVERQELSVREKEIVVCIVKGMTNKQIAEELCLSTHTIMTHRRNITNKLEIHSSSGLTIYAIVNKLVEFDRIKNIISYEK